MGSHLPCWTIQTTELRLGKADENILKSALSALGFTNIHLNDEYARRFGAKMTADRFSDRVSFVLKADGNAQVTAASSSPGILEKVTGEVARAYTEENVNVSAAENGWSVEWSTTEDGNRVATVNRGGY